MIQRKRAPVRRLDPVGPYAYARHEKLDYTQFLELVLSDEVERRDHKHLANRLQNAGFEEECTLERFDWSAKIRVDNPR